MSGGGNRGGVSFRLGSAFLSADRKSPAGRVLRLLSTARHVQIISGGGLCRALPGLAHARIRSDTFFFRVFKSFTFGNFSRPIYSICITRSLRFDFSRGIFRRRHRAGLFACVFFRSFVPRCEVRSCEREKKWKLEN